MSFTNLNDVPLALAVWLVSDNYDGHSKRDKYISVTSLLKSVRQIVLTNRVKQAGTNLTNDVMDQVSSSIGSAIHDAVERSWIKDYKGALHKLGYPKHIIDRVKINPTEDELTEGTLPIYIEQRVEKTINGWVVSGKYDFIVDGQIQDLKTTGTYSWTKGKNDNKYIMQGSMYKWLNPTIITKNTMAVNFVFTDWDAFTTRDNYPKSRIESKTLDLLSVFATEEFIKTKLEEIDFYLDKPESEIPLCNSEDLWLSESTYKYFKKGVVGDRSTRTFDSYKEAQERLISDGSTGIIVEHKGKAKACAYCPASSICSQSNANSL